MSKIRKTILKNGIKVISEEVADFQSVSIGVWVNIGSRDEGDENNGVSHFIEHLLFKGTKKRSARDIAREIESVGGVLNAFTGREYTCFYAKVLSEDMPVAVDLLSDIFLNSEFDPAEIEKEREVVLQEIKMVEDTPDDLIHDLFAANLWKSHPIGKPILGNVGTIKSLKRESIIEYFKNRYIPDTVIITSAGNLKHAQLVKYLKPFERFKSAHRFERLKEIPEPTSSVISQKKKLEQVHICIGVPSPSQTDADRYKTYILNTILGGGMSSRLFQEIREKRGLAYSVYSYLNIYADTGALVVYAGVSDKNASKTIDLIVREMKKLKKEPVTRDELKVAKEQLKGGMLLGLETTENRMSKLAKDEIYFKRNVPVKDIIREIEKVKPSDIKELAEKMFDTGHISMTAIGNIEKGDIPRILRDANRFGSS